MSDNTPEYEYERLSDLADSGELTQEKLQETLNKYAAALQQEFEDSTNKNPENIEEYTRNFFKNNIYAAAGQIVFLSNNSESDSIRLRASQFIVQQALADCHDDGDPIKDLLKELAKSPAPTPDQLAE